MMRVDAQVIHPFPAIGNCRRKDAAAAIRRNAVDGSVGRITAPRAIFNYFVCGVLPEAKGKYPMNTILTAYQIQIPLCNVLPKHFLGRVGFSPLRRISGLRHKSSGAGIDLQNSPKIASVCLPDMIFHGLLLCFLFIIPYENDRSKPGLY